MKVILVMIVTCALYGQVISGWAFPGPDHRLHYLTDPNGNSIMDFSSAGYRAGGVRLPSAVAVQRLTPASGDSTARIQAALDNTTGAVVLAPGEYELAGTLTIAHSGVVLHGEKGASIRLTGKPHAFLEIRGAGTWHEEGPPAPVLDAYVPSGASAFRVQNAAAFHPGDRVLILHPVTAEWIRFMGWDKLLRDGQPQAPVGAGKVIRTDRVVDLVEGDRVTLDVPLSDALDSRFTAASLVRYSFPGRITEVGVEGLRIVAPLEDLPITEPHYSALSMDAVEDGWARDLEIQETQNGVMIGPGSKRLTLTNVHITHSPAHSESVGQADFQLQGTQILLDRCRVTGAGTWPVITQSDVTGPLVILNFAADHGGVGPHQGWATGVLVDGGNFPAGTEHQPALDFSASAARLGRGSSFGWAVAWNIASPFLLVQQPPGALNWCIGCVGTPVTSNGTPVGTFDSPGKMVVPSSLYLQQLRDRLGPGALQSIGYSDAAGKLI